MISSLIYPSLPQGILETLLNSFLWHTFGTLDALSAYQSLPDKAKSHLVVKNDNVILPEASLHYGLKQARSALKESLRAQMKQPNADRTALYRQLRAIKDSKVHHPYDPLEMNVRPHTTPLTHLHTYHKHRADHSRHPHVSAQQVLDSKVRHLLHIRS